MKEKIVTEFYPKTTNYQGKSKTSYMSKLILTEKLNNSKIDYYDILSQIKSKRNNFGNSTLFHNFQHNNTQKINLLRHKLMDQNIQTQTALITEPTYGKKAHSYKKISKNFTFSDSSKKAKLVLKNKLSTPKKLINKIIKFEEEKKIEKKIKIEKKREPVELSNNYKEYIEKIKKFNFYNKYSNSNTDYAHSLRAKYYVNKVNESLKQEKKRNDKYIQREREKKEEEKESRDVVFYPSLDLQKISKQIKLILGNQNNFNQFDKTEKFFDNFENKINFLYDNFKPPTIKNNLTKMKIEDIIDDKHLNLVNRIGNSAINYLSNATIKFQREKDEKRKFLIEKNKIANKYKYYKKLSSEFIYNSKEEIEKIIYKNYYLKNDDDSIHENALTKEEIFEKKNYFEDKYDKKGNVSIAGPKLRKYFFDKINDKVNSKYNVNDLMHLKI